MLLCAMPSYAKICHAVLHCAITLTKHVIAIMTEGSKLFYSYLFFHLLFSYFRQCLRSFRGAQIRKIFLRKLDQNRVWDYSVSETFFDCRGCGW